MWPWAVRHRTPWMPVSIPQERAVELPVDQLGLIVLRDLLESNEWNQHNYINDAQHHAGYGLEASRALAEALGWLRARGLIGTDPGKGSPDAIFVTRAEQSFKKVRKRSMSPRACSEEVSIRSSRTRLGRSF